MERRASTAWSYLEQMLLDETAEPKALPLSLLEDITGGFSDDQQIGSGGFAVVYKGRLGDKAVAVKRLSNVFMNETEFHREVECLMQVKHNNVVRFFGYCADRQGSMEKYNGKFVMADVHQRLLCFEYIPKGSLDKYISDAYREWGTCYKIIKGICEGLQYLHENHIIHLDLKPTNILLDDNMVPKITDFGLSRCFDENQSRHITKNILGTMGYLAPELREGGVIARSADLYSLGVIIIEILTGQKGYKSIEDVLESWSDRLERSQRDTQREQIRVCYKTALECRDFNPKKRPASARVIVDRLHEVESIRMGKLAGRFFRSFISGKKDKGKGVRKAESEETPKWVAVTPESKQKRWSFRSPPAVVGAGKDTARGELAFPEHHGHALEESPKLVAKQAAATTVLYGTLSAAPGSKQSVISVEDAAAIKIQAVVRSYLARRTLRALKALVRLQALARGQQVRRQMSSTLRCMQSIVAVQELALTARRQRQLLDRGRRPGYGSGARAVAVPLARPQGGGRLTGTRRYRHNSQSEYQVWW